MWKNRITFIPFWALLMILLIIFPGFEIRALAIGLLPGSPIFFLFSSYDWIWFQLSAALVFSGLLIIVCSWLMDRAAIYRWFLPLILFLMVVSACFFSNKTISYEGWENHPANAGIQDRVTYQSYEKIILIPAALAGAICGFYLGTAGCTAISLVVLWRRRGKKLTKNA